MKILEVNNLTKRFGGLIAVNNVNFSINEREIFGLIGPNGSGKTVLFNTLSGVYKNDGGEVFFNGEDITNMPAHVITEKGIGRTFQENRVFQQLTVLENVMVGRHCRKRSHVGSAIFRTGLARREDKDTREEAIRILKLIEIPPGLVTVKDTLSSQLNYVRTRLVGFAIAMATEPKMLFLDEPVAGMNPTEINNTMELIKRIRESGITVFVIEHHIKAILGICDRVMVMNMGDVIAEGIPEEVVKNREVIEAYLGKGFYDA